MAFDVPVIEHWLKWKITPIFKDWSNKPSHIERMLLPWSYISFPPVSEDKIYYVKLLNGNTDLLHYFGTKLTQHNRK